MVKIDFSNDVADVNIKRKDDGNDYWDYPLCELEDVILNARDGEYNLSLMIVEDRAYEIEFD